nr:DUF6702 family protein [uncultured Carboxylicivirga sp.]
MKFGLKNLLLAALFTFNCFSVSAHPIKMTTGKLEIDVESKSCKLTINFFADDFESALQSEFPQPSFNYDNPQPEMIETIKNYVSGEFLLSVDDKEVKLELLKVKMIEENVCQVTFSGDLKTVRLFETVTIKNTLLFDVYNKQSNILHLIFNGDKITILQFYPAAPVRKERLQ